MNEASCQINTVDSAEIINQSAAPGFIIILLKMRCPCQWKRKAQRGLNLKTMIGQNGGLQKYFTYAKVARSGIIDKIAMFHI